MTDNANSSTNRSNRKGQTWDDYEGTEILGEGSYGKIYKVREKNDEKKVMVIKEIDTSQLRKDYKALEEINVMARMNSP